MEGLDIKASSEELRDALELNRLDRELKAKYREEQLAERRKLLAMTVEEREVEQLRLLERKRLARKRLREESKDRKIGVELEQAWRDSSAVVISQEVLVQISAGEK